MTVANRAPEAVGNIPGVEARVGDTVVVDVAAYFSDPDGDALTYEAATSNGGVATVSVSGSGVAVAAVVTGTATVTVTASDPGGLSARQAFAVTVAGDAITTEITRCEVRTVIWFLLDEIVIAGTAYASRSVLDVKLLGEADGSRVGVQLLGRMAAGQEKDFTIRDSRWLGTGSSPECTVQAEWRERDDPPGKPEVTLATNVGNAPEGAAVTLRMLVSPSPEEAISVSYTRSADADPATADADEADFVHGSTGTIEVAAGASEATIEIDVNDDADVEPATEFFTVTLDSPGEDAGYQLGWVPSALAYIEEGVCDRTQQVRDRIAGSRDCHTVTDWHLDQIQRLDLTPSRSSRPIVALKPGDFLGLYELQRLELDDNRITELPSGIFSGLSNLESLHLNGNRLAVLPPGVFSDLSSLEGLNLTGNGLAELPPDVFSDLTDLVWLYLGENRLAELPPEVFSGLTELRSLRLDDNRVQELPAGVFTDLTGLSTLRIQGNQIAELPPGVFGSLTGLTELELQGNRITQLPAGVFESLSQLDRLELQGNRISELPAGSFSGLSGLTWLDLNSNGLARLEGDAFAGMPVLERLSLWRNRIAELPPRVFAGLYGGLTSMGMSSNPGHPFTLTLELERRDDDDLKAAGPAKVGVTVVEAAPFRMHIPLAVEGGTLSQDYVILEAGYTGSSEVTVTLSSGSSTATVSVDSLPEGPQWVDINLAAGEAIVLFGSSG